MSLAFPTTHETSDGSQQNLQKLFSRDELEQFSADDAAAGRRIGKILASLFIYTLLAMSVAIWWTFRTVGH